MKLVETLTVCFVRAITLSEGAELYETKGEILTALDEFLVLIVKFSLTTLSGSLAIEYYANSAFANICAGVSRPCLPTSLSHITY